MDVAKVICLPAIKQPRFWPNEQQETCFSWNNKNADTGQVLGYGNNLVPTEHEGSDYVNLGAGLPANQIPAQVTAAYPAGVNGGSAYDHEYHVSASFGDRRPKSHAHVSRYADAAPAQRQQRQPQLRHAYRHSDRDRTATAHTDSHSHCRTPTATPHDRHQRQRLLRVVLPQ